MKRLLKILMPLGIVLLLCACSAQNAESPDKLQLPAEAIPAAEPVSCQGFGDLAWGGSVESIVGPYTEVLQRSAEFAGHNAYALYSFDENGELSSGCYYFNPNASLEWSEAAKMYFDIRNALMESYGAPAETQSSDGQPAPSIYEAAEAGEGSCIDIWQGLTDSAGRHIGIDLQLLSDGRISLSFIAR